MSQYSAVSVLLLLRVSLVAVLQFRSYAGNLSLKAGVSSRGYVLQLGVKAYGGHRGRLNGQIALVFQPFGRAFLGLASWELQHGSSHVV